MRGIIQTLTAPVITQPVSFTQPDPTDVLLTMTATGQDDDPLEYFWQLIAAPSNDPAPGFEAAYQSTLAVMYAAGTYVFLGTATDLYNGLVATSSVTVTVNQVVSDIQFAFGSPTIMPGDTVQFGATACDQFGATMNATLTWSASGGTIDSNGLYTAPVTQGSASVQVNSDAGGGSVSKTAPLTIAIDQNQGSVYVGNDGLIYVQATDVQKVKVFNTNGELTNTLSWDGPFPQGMTFRGAADIYLADGSYLDASGSGQVIVRKDTGGNIIQTYIPSIPDGYWTGMALDPNGTSFWACDESCYVYEFDINSGLEQEDFLASTDLGRLGVMPLPMTPGIKLGDGSANQVLQASEDGTQNLVPLTLYLPSDLPNGTIVTLSTTAANEVDVWNGGTLLFGNGNSLSSIQWIVGQNNIPTTLYVGATQGSTTAGDIQFTVNVTPPSDDDPSATTAPASAEKISIALGTTNIGATRILTSVGGLDPSDLVPLNYKYDVPGGDVILSISPEAASEIEVWATDHPTASDTPILGGPAHRIFVILSVNDPYNGHLWVGATARSGTPDDIQFTLKASATPSLLKAQTIRATVVPGVIDIFFDGTNNDPSSDTNVYKMFRAVDCNLAWPIYEAGVGTGGIAGGWHAGALDGTTCQAIEDDAWKRMVDDLDATYKGLVSGTISINIIGFSRGGVEALDFANRVETVLNTTCMFSYPGTTSSVKATGAHISFLGLFDPVDAINATRDNSGTLNIHVPTGIGKVIEVVALSEHREMFNWINLIGSPPTTVIGFMGAHSDIGGGYGADPISQSTLHYMMDQAAFALKFSAAIPPAVAYTASDVHDSWMQNMGGFNHGTIEIGPIRRSPAFPVGLPVYTPTGIVTYGLHSSSFWDPYFGADDNIYNLPPF